MRQAVLIVWASPATLLGLTAGVFGLLSGVYPAWRMSRVHPVVALKGTR